MSNKLIKNNINNQRGNYYNYNGNKKSALLCVLVVIIAIVVIGIIIFKPKSSNVSGQIVTNADYSYKDVKISDDQMLSGMHYAEIKIKNYGDIVVALDADNTPITVTNFVKLVGDKFYDGLTFHRLMSGFMIQGGDPKHDGTGGAEKNIKGEFKTNGVNNDILHKRGVISMARSNDNDSASSQFFICHKDSSHLDGNYAAFGYVYGANGENTAAFNKYMDVVDKICKDASKKGINGVAEYKDQPVIESIRIVEFNK